jgi:HPt (histidine-containing phosphotransfer) domain-containing protein
MQAFIPIHATGVRRLRIIPVDTSPAFDRHAALNRLGGDEVLFHELVEYFRGDAPQLVNSLRTALLHRDFPSIEQTAHALRGLLASCGGVRAAAEAQRLEDTARNEAEFAISPLVASLCREIELFQALLH